MVFMEYYLVIILCSQVRCRTVCATSVLSSKKHYNSWDRSNIIYEYVVIYEKDKIFTFTSRSLAIVYWSWRTLCSNTYVFESPVACS